MRVIYRGRRVGKSWANRAIHMSALLCCLSGNKPKAIVLDKHFFDDQMSIFSDEFAENYRNGQ